ncbi:MAG TPA: PEFG-CTERM sorting domain-containing protein [Nitrososphaera sp.]|nr:PEFG-CTERM sorting domain-containing protein [Nitrososphaera sp.]
MDYKTYALMAILLASVASVALVGAAYAQTRLTVETDAESYKTGDTITVSGQLNATTINTNILLQVLDEQGNRDRFDQFPVAADGSYSYSFTAGGLMNTNGTYTVRVNYKTTEEETTFEFVSTEGPRPAWRPIDVNINGTNHRIEYMITGSGNRLDGITGDVTTISFIAELTAQSDGILSLRFNEEIFDADVEFVAFVDEIPFDGELAPGPGATNTIHIDFEAGTEQIEILGDHIIPEFGAIAAIILAIAIVGIIVATTRYNKFKFAPRL